MNESKEPEKLHRESDASGEEDIIELTDVFENTTEEDVIELSDVVEPLPADNGEAKEDTLIELTDVVTDDAAELEKAPEFVAEESNKLDRMLIDEIEEVHTPADDLADSLGVDLAPDTEAPSTASDTSASDTSSSDVSTSDVSTSDVSGQLDAAIERVVKEMLSDKIDTILNRVIEKEVTKEIDRIKRLLSDELSDTDDTV